MPGVTNKSSTTTAPRIEEQAHSELRPKSSWEKIIHSRTTVFCLLFGAMGVLGVPVLCLSPVFSVREKWLWSLVVTIYTGILAAIAIWSCAWAWSEYRKAFY